MDVSEFPKLDRRMYGHRPDSPEIEQENDVDGSFVDAPAGIPSDLLAIIHEQRSVDPPVEIVIPEKSAESFTEENPNSRFRVLDMAVKKPGHCLVCLSDGNDERQFVDFGKTVEWYGVVYICTFCLKEVANIIGLNVSQESFDGMRKGYQDEIESADDRWVAAQEEIRAARLLLRNCTCGDSVTSAPSPDFVEADSEPESNDSDPDESGSLEESGDVSESSVDGSGDESESTLEPEKPKRTRRGSNSG